MLTLRKRKRSVLVPMPAQEDPCSTPSLLHTRVGRDRPSSYGPLTAVDLTRLWDALVSRALRNVSPTLAAGDIIEHDHIPFRERMIASEEAADG